MDARKLTKQVRLTRWAGLMRERKESDQTVKTWSQENEVNEKTYYYWQRKLREAVCEELTNIVPSGFLEIQTTEPPPETGKRKDERINPLSIEIGGIHITADSTYPPAQLAALLRELARPC
jgi:hypothetical protein